MKYQLKQETLQALLEYLAKQPYQDVFQLIQALQQAEEVEEE